MRTNTPPSEMWKSIRSLSEIPQPTLLKTIEIKTTTGLIRQGLPRLVSRVYPAKGKKQESVLVTMRGGGEWTAIAWRELYPQTPSVKSMAEIPEAYNLPALLRAQISLALCHGLVTQVTHDAVWLELRGK